MAEEMSLTHLPLTLIVAATAKNGIGKNGGLPWPMLKKDMAYFASVTKRVPAPQDTGSLQSDSLKSAALEGTRQNVVIMGRKTWDSIPTKMRPLKNRTNVVISAQDRSSLTAAAASSSSIPEDVVVASDIPTALQTLEHRITDGKALPVARAFIIGGTSIYKAALDLPQTKRILLTRIHKDYDCDTVFPLELGSSGSSSSSTTTTTSDCAESSWRQACHAQLEAYVGEAVHSGPQGVEVDGERIELDFQLFERDSA